MEPKLYSVYIKFNLPSLELTGSTDFLTVSNDDMRFLAFLRRLRVVAEQFFEEDPLVDSVEVFDNSYSFGFKYPPNDEVK